MNRLPAFAVIKEVARKVKTQKALKAMKMLHLIAFVELQRERTGARTRFGKLFDLLLLYALLVLWCSLSSINGEADGGGAGPDLIHHHESRKIIEEVLDNQVIGEQQEEEMRQMFTFYDADGSGCVSVLRAWPCCLRLRTVAVHWIWMSLRN